jgi:hypothetical protein
MVLDLKETDAILSRFLNNISGARNLGGYANSWSNRGVHQQQ